MKYVKGEFLRNANHRSLVRHVGFSMAVVGMLAGMVAVVVAITLGSSILGGIAAGSMVMSFLLLPVTDLRFPRSRGW